MKNLHDIHMDIANGVTHGEKPTDTVYEQLILIHEFTGRTAERHPEDPRFIIVHDGECDKNGFASVVLVPIFETVIECKQWCKKHLCVTNVIITGSMEL